MHGARPRISAHPEITLRLCRRGHVATIHPGKDFYIALSEHHDWSSGHTVWGFIEDLAAVDAIVARPFTSMKHVTYGTEMRMMNEPTKFSVFLADAAQSTVSGSSIQQQQ